MLEFTIRIKEEDLGKIQDFFEKWVDDFERPSAPANLIEELFYLYDERAGDCLDLRKDVSVCENTLPTPQPTYKIVRNYFRGHTKRTIKSGLTLREAQTHCKDPEASSATCEKAENKRRTHQLGPWFDSYVMEWR